MAVLWIILLYVVIGLIWRTAEKVVHKEVTPRPIDGVVAIILAVSLYFNFW